MCTPAQTQTRSEEGGATRTRYIRRVFPIGVLELRGNKFTLTNRTYSTSVEYDDEHAARMEKLLMAGGYTGGSVGNRGKSNPNRITGLFKTKRPDLLVGGVNADALDNLIGIIKKAKSAGKGITFFVWKNTKFADGPAYTLNADVERDKSERPAPKRRIAPDDAFGEDAGGDPFGD